MWLLKKFDLIWRGSAALGSNRKQKTGENRTFACYDCIATSLISFLACCKHIVLNNGPGGGAKFPGFCNNTFNCNNPATRQTDKVVTSLTCICDMLSVNPSWYSVLTKLFMVLLSSSTRMLGKHLDMQQLLAFKPFHCVIQLPSCHSALCTAATEGVERHKGNPTCTVILKMINWTQNILYPTETFTRIWRVRQWCLTLSLGVVDFVHRPEFRKARKRNDSETESVDGNSSLQNFVFSSVSFFLEFRMMNEVH